MASFITSREWLRLTSPAASIRPRGEPSRISSIRSSRELALAVELPDAGHQVVRHDATAPQRPGHARGRWRWRSRNRRAIGHMSQPPACISSSKGIPRGSGPGRGRVAGCLGLAGTAVGHPAGDQDRRMILESANRPTPLGPHSGALWVQSRPARSRQVQGPWRDPSAPSRSSMAPLTPVSSARMPRAATRSRTSRAGKPKWIGIAGGSRAPGAGPPRPGRRHWWRWRCRGVRRPGRRCAGAPGLLPTRRASTAWPMSPGSRMERPPGLDPQDAGGVVALPRPPRPGAEIGSAPRTSPSPAPPGRARPPGGPGRRARRSGCAPPAGGALSAAAPPLWSRSAWLSTRRSTRPTPGRPRKGATTRAAGVESALEAGTGVEDQGPVPGAHHRGEPLTHVQQGEPGLPWTRHRAAHQDQRQEQRQPQPAPGQPPRGQQQGHPAKAAGHTQGGRSRQVDGGPGPGGHPGSRSARHQSSRCGGQHQRQPQPRDQAQSRLGHQHQRKEHQGEEGLGHQVHQGRDEPRHGRTAGAGAAGAPRPPPIAPAPSGSRGRGAAGAAPG